MKKEAIIGQADVTASHADLTIKPATLSTSFGKNTLFIVDEPVKTQEAADALAKSKAEVAGGSAYEVTAVCQGSAELRAGTAISITASTSRSRASGRSAAAATSSGRARTGRPWSAAAARTGR